MTAVMLGFLVITVWSLWIVVRPADLVWSAEPDYGLF